MDASIRSISQIIGQLKDLQAAQKDNLTDSYMFGLYNGLELALATIEGRDPIYEEAGSKKYATRRNLYDVRHPDDVALVRFAMCMRSKLEAARAKGREGWETASGSYLSTLLRAHVDKGDPLDVANFCMFLHQRGDRIYPEGRR
jgi:hypothetical protein